MNNLRNFNAFINENLDEEEGSVGGMSPQSAEAEGFVAVPDMGSFFKVEDDALWQVPMLRNGAPDRDNDGQLNVIEVTFLHPNDAAMLVPALSHHSSEHEVHACLDRIEVVDDER